jgi:hypothetical protein
MQPDLFLTLLEAYRVAHPGKKKQTLDGFAVFCREYLNQKPPATILRLQNGGTVLTFQDGSQLQVSDHSPPPHAVVNPAPVPPPASSYAPPPGFQPSISAVNVFGRRS